MERFAPASQRTVVWSVLAALLLIALALWPAAVAGWVSGPDMRVDALPGLVASGFAEWVRSGQASSEPLAAAVSFWAVFHVVKVVVAAALLVVLIPIGRALWRYAVRTQSRRKRAAMSGLGVAGAPLVHLLVLVVMANVQGAVAPLSSVLTFLPSGGAAVQQVRQELASGHVSPPVTAMIGDFRLYHAALAGTAIVAILAVLVATAVLWLRRRRIPRAQRRLRGLLALGGALTPVMALFLGVVLAANLSTVADTAPALAAFFDGSGT